MQRRDPRRRMLTLARYRAKKKGIPFSLELEDIHVPEYCPALGIPLRPSSGRPGPNSPSLDRVVPERGYVKGNVIVVSNLANSIKWTATPEQLERLAGFYRKVRSS